MLLLLWLITVKIIIREFLERKMHKKREETERRERERRREKVAEVARAENVSNFTRV